EPVPLEPYRELGILVVEDCAQAIGARDRGSPVGARGDAAVFSFAPTKVLTCGGPGGGVASPRAATVDEVRDLAGHDEKDDDRQRNNGLMGDLHASVAAVQMERLKEFLDRRRALARLYDERLLPLGLERPASSCWRARRPGASSNPPCSPSSRRSVSRRSCGCSPSAAALSIDRTRARGTLDRHPVSGGWRSSRLSC